MQNRFSRVSLFITLWTIAHQAPLSMGFSRQEHWSRLSCPPSEDLPNPEIEPASLVSPVLQADSLPSEPLWYSEAYKNCPHNLPPPSNNIDSANGGWQGGGPCGECLWKANWRIHPLDSACLQLQGWVWGNKGEGGENQVQIIYMGFMVKHSSLLKKIFS